MKTDQSITTFAPRSSWIITAALSVVLLAGCDVTYEESVELSSQPPTAESIEAADPIESDAAVITPSDPEPTTTNSLTVGDKAPELHLAKYMKGEPVDLSSGDRVHVVEFWATWCGPCRVGMPHISELQQHHGDDVAFVGVTREDESTVQGFFEQEAMDGKTWDEVIQYRIALDDGSQTNKDYMQAAGQNGIPCAFIVGRDGFVEWIGHPARIDDPLQQVVDGVWDRDVEAKRFVATQKLQQLSRNLRMWINAENWDDALAALEQLQAETGKSADIAMQKLMILERAGRSEEANEVRGEVVELAWDNSAQLNAISWDIATSGDKSNLEIALKGAKRASELTKDSDPAILDTLARVYYEMGQLDEAIEWQKKAVEHNKGQMPQIDQVLEQYLAEKEGE